MKKIHATFEIDTFKIMDARNKIQILEIMLQFLTFDLHIWYLNLKEIVTKIGTEWHFTRVCTTNESRDNRIWKYRKFKPPSGENITDSSTLSISDL